MIYLLLILGLHINNIQFFEDHDLIKMIISIIQIYKINGYQLILDIFILTEFLQLINQNIIFEIKYQVLTIYYHLQQILDD